MKDKEYIAIIGDLIDSKKDKDRKEGREKLLEVIAEVNKKYRADLASDFVVLKGDEIQGLLASSKNLIKIIMELELEMMPRRLRFGIGRGGVDSRISRHKSWENDGPAYHRARSMIDEVRARERGYTRTGTSIMYAGSPDDIGLEGLINTIFYLASTIKVRWSPRQMEIINGHFHSDKNQYKTADLLGIRQSSVSKSLKAASYYAYLEAMEALSSYLSEKL